MKSEILLNDKGKFLKQYKQISRCFLTFDHLIIAINPSPDAHHLRSYLDLVMNASYEAKTTFLEVKSKYHDNYHDFDEEHIL